MEIYLRCECCSKEYTKKSDIYRLRSYNYSKLQKCKKNNKLFYGGAWFIICNNCKDCLCNECDNCHKNGGCICCKSCKKKPVNCICKYMYQITPKTSSRVKK